MPEREIAEVYADGRMAAEQRAEPRMIGTMIVAYAVARGGLGHTREAIALLEEAQPVAKQCGDRELRVVSHIIGYWLDLAGRLGDALAQVEQMIEASRDDPNLGRATFGFSAHALATVLRGQVLAEMGRLREAQATVDEAVGLARACDDVESLGWALGTYPLLAWLNGEPGDSLARARDSAEIAERLGSSFSRTAAHVGLAYAHNARAEWDEAGSAAERALEIAREARAAIQYEPQMRAALAEAKTGSRDYRAAVELAERAIGVARRRETRVFEVNAAIALARALRSLEGVAARDQFPSYSLTPPNSPASASVGTSSASARRAGRATEARRRPRRLRARASRGPAPV